VKDKITLREWVNDTIEDIQQGGNRIWKMSAKFPDSMKGSIAKRMWHDDTFSYGIEYGALIILQHLHDFSEFIEYSELASDREVNKDE